jgi:hypothetical protein
MAKEVGSEADNRNMQESPDADRLIDGALCHGQNPKPAGAPRRKGTASAPVSCNGQSAAFG